MSDNLELLKQVRLELLQMRATGSTGFGLSYIVQAVSPKLFAHSVNVTNTQCVENMRSRFASGGLKTHRGRVQWCLARLAVAGLLYTRRGPEGGVAPYEHGETDKRFRFRMTQEQAIAALGSLKIEIRKPTIRSYHLTKSLEAA
jgi:hypothetical protein